MLTTMVSGKCVDAPQELWALEGGVQGQKGIYHRIRNQMTGSCLDAQERTGRTNMFGKTVLMSELYGNGSDVLVGGCDPSAIDQQWRIAGS